jgi:acetyl-CoA carboxylase biotin carboxyl carrier protein
MSATGQERRWPVDGRAFRRALTVKTVKLADGRFELRSPAVGAWRDGPAPGTLVMPGASLGEIEVLGVLHELHAGSDCHGLVVGETPATRPARVPVEHGALLLTLDPSAGAVMDVEAQAELPLDAHGLVLRAPSSGRFYLRPAPDKPPFVGEGDSIREGATVCLLEIMKTFHRIAYGGAGLPARAKILSIAVADGTDVEVGDVLFELEKA